MACKLRKDLKMTQKWFINHQKCMLLLGIVWKENSNSETDMTNEHRMDSRKVEIMCVRKVSRVEVFPHDLGMMFVIMDRICVMMGYGIIEVPI